MRVLFYFVHPAKFHLFKATVNHLKAEGHQVDILITGRDILEELVQKEGWEYTKIFPNGRKMKGVHIWISAGVYMLLTIWKLFWFTWGKKYNLFVSDDLVTFVGRMKGIPSFFVTDDDLKGVPESVILVASAKYVFAPNVCDMGKYNSKKLGYDGYKSLAHLHPNRFTPDYTKVPDELKSTGEDYFFIRTVSATSTHDVGKRGIGDDLLRKIVKVLEPHGRVVLNSEREVAPDMKKYLLDFDKMDVAHIFAYAKVFISDSTTMCAEAAVLGVPALECDDWFNDFKQYEELSGRYKLLQGFSPDDFDGIKAKLDELLSMEDLSSEFQKRREHLLSEKDDVSAFIIWLIENYPNCIKEYFDDSVKVLKQFKQ
ncbi:hypothetical protein [Roseivirga misakiensis]|uniref:DUF354 domain-containing protein n=1 Tax=Roseivirga misakiensis TaxID=1563681 RepID=A0A1E5T5Y3_9BACT|nr:hypothetical protein [Roseivirga misakiensis]OEK06770.1 hypothetical protein BFP71_03665 [Roseivirga misakiensis]